MRFDVRKALAEIKGGNPPPATLPPATIATFATKPNPAPSRVAVVASVAATQRQNPDTAQRQRFDTDREADAGQLAELLARLGPMTYGAAAAALGWGATRAWRAEAHLRAKGRVRLDALGRATLN